MLVFRYTVSLRDGVRDDNYEKEVRQQLGPHLHFESSVICWLQLPTPSNGRGLAEGLAVAWKQYGSNRSINQ